MFDVNRATVRSYGLSAGRVGVMEIVQSHVPKEPYPGRDRSDFEPELHADRREVTPNHAADFTSAPGATKLAALESARLAAIAKGEHTIAEVDGRILAHPSQDLLKIESLSQTIGEQHSEFFHIGKDDAFIEARL